MPESQKEQIATPNARSLFYELLEPRGKDPSPLARLVNIILFSLILINVLAAIIESVDEFHNRYAAWFMTLEFFSVAVFTVEYLLRLWVCVENPRYGSGWRGRLRYMGSFMALIDLIAILPFYLGMFVNFDTLILRVLRLLRIFKLSRNFTVLEILSDVMRNEAKTLLSAIFVMVILIILAAAGIYLVEHKEQPDAFGSIPRAMWWATVTLTTVGYGDVVPVTMMGRLFGVVITILGVGMAALPAGIIASGFTSEMAHRREAYEQAARRLLKDGKLSTEDRQQLIKTRHELGLDREQAQRALRRATLDYRSSTRYKYNHCPHCGKRLDESSRGHKLP